MYLMKDQNPEVVDEVGANTAWPLILVVQPDIQVYKLLEKLSPETPWGVRKIAAQKLGDQQCPEALRGLMGALTSDPFWMVRCAIIQALEKIGNPKAIPTLQDVAKNDGIQIVRSYAAKSIERLS